MKKNILFLILVAGGVIAAQLGTLNRSSDVTTAAELAAYSVSTNSIQAQIDVLAALLDGGITTNLSSLLITNGVVKGTY